MWEVQVFVLFPYVSRGPIEGRPILPIFGPIKGRISVMLYNPRAWVSAGEAICFLVGRGHRVAPTMVVGDLGIPRVNDIGIPRVNDTGLVPFVSGQSSPIV